MSLLSDLDAFYLEHRRCGQLEGDVSESGHDVAVWMECSCGAMLCREIVAGAE